MKKKRNHSELKDQENSPEGTNNETDLFSLIDTKFKKNVMRDFPGGPVVKNRPSNAGDMGLIPGWGTKTLNAAGELRP